MLPNDHNAGSTSKAQPSHCTGEVGEGQTADPVFYDALRSNGLVFIVARVSFPGSALGRRRPKLQPLLVSQWPHSRDTGAGGRWSAASFSTGAVGKVHPCAEATEGKSHPEINSCSKSAGRRKGRCRVWV